MHLRSFLLNLPFAYLSAISWALIAFAVSFRVRRHAVIDVFWGSGFLVVLSESLLVASTRHGASFTWLQWLTLGLTAAWSLRLTAYLAWRQRGAAEDPRYVAILARAGGKRPALTALRVVYLLQATLLFVVSIPLQWVAFSATSPIAALAGIGGVLVVVGTLFEAVGDDQLRRFLKDDARRGTTLNTGLWRYTRHPNYFGEAVLWSGLYLLAASTPYGWATFASSALMIWLVARLSGKPMLERRLAKTRSGYREYIESTSGFFPWPPKKKA